jgi:pimeloyl-ACP methyl ester carboxylesterase
MRQQDRPSSPSVAGAPVAVRVATAPVAARVAAALAMTAALAATPPLAHAAKTPRPDLVVKKGDARVSKGRLLVGFTIKNSGNAKAAPSRAAIATVVAGKVVVLAKVSVSGLRAGRSGSGVAKAAIPKKLTSGSHELSVCADHGHAVAETSETNNCFDLGTYAAGKVTDPVGGSPIRKPADVPTAGPPAGPGPTTPGTTTAPSVTGSTVPTDPVARRTSDVYRVGDSWVYVPDTYDASNQTPIRLLVWMHGCGGVSEGELWNATAGSDQNYLGMAPTGADGTCWDVNGSPATVLAQIAALETHFNIDRRRIVLGGYSSGGDMSYRMGLDHPAMFAGLLVENSTPFRDSGTTNAQAIAATTKFPVVHLAHLQDATYPIATVRTETDQLVADGFPVKRIEVDGTHYDEPGATVKGHKVAGTDPDVATYLLPHMTDDWQAATG